MLKSKIFCIFAFIIFYSCATKESERFKIMSYNVENLFDIENDSLTNDNQFTPTGDYYWTYNKYKKKLADIAKVITAVGEWEAPALVGLCEIENRKVLFDLVKNSPLEVQNYSFVHKESPDDRGIDVALLYKKDKFKLIKKEFISIKYPNKPNTRTRDILFATGIIPTGDTLYVFVNHWPSRIGGELESESKRMYVASVLRNKIDSLFKSVEEPKIVIMGDFNDFPDNKSISRELKALKLLEGIEDEELYNLYSVIQEKGEVGTYKMAGEWNVLDQIIVSGALLNKENNIFTTQDDAHVFSADFLLQNDEKNLGKRPFRTYQGLKYWGGISDHLPVFVDFTIEEKLDK